MDQSLYYTMQSQNSNGNLAKSDYDSVNNCKSAINDKPSSLYNSVHVKTKKKNFTAANKGETIAKMADKFKKTRVETQ